MLPAVFNLFVFSVCSTVCTIPPSQLKRLFGIFMSGLRWATMVSSLFIETRKADAGGKKLLVEETSDGSSAVNQTDQPVPSQPI